MRGAAAAAWFRCPQLCTPEPTLLSRLHPALAVAGQGLRPRQEAYCTAPGSLTITTKSNIHSQRPCCINIATPYLCAICAPNKTAEFRHKNATWAIFWEAVLQLSLQGSCTRPRYAHWCLAGCQVRYSREDDGALKSGTMQLPAPLACRASQYVRPRPDIGSIHTFKTPMHLYVIAYRSRH